MSYLGQNIGKLGFGLMRLPKTEDKQIDVEQTKEMVDAFLAAGFTYFDTAYGYTGSEDAIRQALVERYPRESYQLATKLSAWSGAKTAEEAKAMFDTSLERTGAGYFDFYLLHNVGGNRTKIFDDFGIWDYVLSLRDKGLVKHVGFSYHGKADALDEVLAAHPEMEFVQLQINYADWEDKEVQSRMCLETAQKYGKPVVIMEPVKGGLLAAPPQVAADILSAAAPEAAPASWALRFAASQKGIITVLSGMSNLQQMQDNIATMKDFKPLDEKELETVKAAAAAIAALPSIPCTSCHYCEKGCPNSVRIPSIISALNRYLIYGNLASSKGSYGFATMKGGKASECVQCMQCEEVCPQHIDITGNLAKAAELFE